MNGDQPDYYHVLGLDSSATLPIIEATFASLQTEYASKMENPEDDPKYQQILYAYEVLSDPDRKSIYDSLLKDTKPSLLQVNVQLSRKQIELADVPQVVYMLVDVKPMMKPGDVNLPLNLCLVLDRSTSMQGERLDQVKAAVELIVDKLGPEDVMSVVSFSDRAEVVLPAGHVSHKVALLGKIRGILASGGTEIFQGLRAGVGEMRQMPLKHYTNHLILLTDGHTYGDADQCLQLARDTAVQGIGISAFGIGGEWNDHFLDKLVAPSGGQSGFIDSPEEIIEFLQKRIKGLGDIYARNVRLLPNFPDAISLKFGFKLTPYAQPLPLRYEEPAQLGDIEGRMPLSFLLELILEPQTIETRLRLPIHLVADIPSEQMKDRAFDEQVQLVVLSEPPRMDPPPDIVKAVRMLNIYRMNEKVWEDVEAGELEGATVRMRHLTTRLLEAGQTKLAQQAHMEAQRLEKLGTMSLEGRKSLKYGTRSLMSRMLDWTQDDDDV